MNSFDSEEKLRLEKKKLHNKRRRTMKLCPNPGKRTRESHKIKKHLQEIPEEKLVFNSYVEVEDKSFFDRVEVNIVKINNDRKETSKQEETNLNLNIECPVESSFELEDAPEIEVDDSNQIGLELQKETPIIDSYSLQTKDPLWLVALSTNSSLATISSSQEKEIPIKDHPSQRQSSKISRSDPSLRLHTPPAELKSKFCRKISYDALWQVLDTDEWIPLLDGGKVKYISKFWKTEDDFSNIKQEDRLSEFKQDTLKTFGSRYPMKHLGIFKAVEGIRANCSNNDARNINSCSLRRFPVTLKTIEELNKDFLLENELNSDETIIYVGHPPKSNFDFMLPDRTSKNQDHMNLHKDGKSTVGEIITGCYGASGVVRIISDNIRNTGEQYWLPTGNNTGYCFDGDENYLHGRELNIILKPEEYIVAHVYRHMQDLKPDQNIYKDTEFAFPVNINWKMPSIHSYLHTTTIYISEKVHKSFAVKEYVEMNRNLIIYEDPSLLYWQPGDVFRNKTILQLLHLFPGTQKGIAGKNEALAIYFGKKGFYQNHISLVEKQTILIKYYTPKGNSSSDYFSDDASKMHESFRNKLQIRVFGPLSLLSQLKLKSSHTSIASDIIYLINGEIINEEWSSKGWVFTIIGRLSVNI